VTTGGSDDFNRPFHMWVKGAEVRCFHSLNDADLSGLVLQEFTGVPAKFVRGRGMWCQVVVGPSNGVSDANPDVGRIKLEGTYCNFMQRGRWAGENS